MQKIPTVQLHTPATNGDGKIHVRLTEGLYQNIRRLISWPLLGLFFGLVWVQHNGQPWLLFSFAQHKIIVFGHAYSWFDLTLLAGLMVAGAFLLCFMAVAWGRVWCGFACPQSIWTWLFIRIEQFTEGRASQRARREGQPLTAQQTLRRIAKHTLWLLLAMATAITFTGYFVPVRDIFASAAALQMSPLLLGWLLIMSALTYLNAGLVREKICLHACPYSRIQGVMFDQHTRTVSYDTSRGEPRACKRNRSKRNNNKHQGDCVDCSLCVQVCLVGIDIRQGLQAACIDCGACIDACDKVMTTINRPKGLIRFASLAQLQNKPSPQARTRLAGYAAALLLATSAVAYGFTHTTSLQVAISRDRNALTTRLGQHHICNNYRIKVESFNPDETQINVAVTGTANYQLFGPAVIDLNQNNGEWLAYRVCDEAAQPGVSEIVFGFEGQAVRVEKETTFLGGGF